MKTTKISSFSSSLETMVRLKERRLSRRRRERRLVAVLDLDHTLLHSTEEWRLSPSEMWRVNSADRPDDLFSVRVPRKKRHGCTYFVTKLRPGARKFISELNEFCNLYIFTHGSRDYANAMVRLLDHDRAGYFKGKIFSREDCPVKGSKTLDIVPEHESLIMVLDDSPEVWEDHSGNVVDILPYDYFDDGAKMGFSKKSFAEMGEDEGDVLEVILTFFREAHQLIFDPDFDDIEDVPSLLAKIRDIQACSEQQPPSPLPPPTSSRINSSDYSESPEKELLQQSMFFRARRSTL